MVFFSEEVIEFVDIVFCNYYIVGYIMLVWRMNEFRIEDGFM